MQTRKLNLIKALLHVILLVWTLCSLGCPRPQPKPTVVIPADLTIKALPDGNYEVTPAWLQKRYDFERWNKQELDDCRTKLKGN